MSRTLTVSSLPHEGEPAGAAREEEEEVRKENTRLEKKKSYCGVLSKNGNCSSSLCVSDICPSLHLFCLFLSVYQPSCNRQWLTGLKAPTN